MNQIMGEPPVGQGGSDRLGCAGGVSKERRPFLRPQGCRHHQREGLKLPTSQRPPAHMRQGIMCRSVHPDVLARAGDDLDAHGMILTPMGRCLNMQPLTALPYQDEKIEIASQVKGA